MKQTIKNKPGEVICNNTLFPRKRKIVKIKPGELILNRRKFLFHVFDNINHFIYGR